MTIRASTLCCSAEDADRLAVLLRGGAGDHVDRVGHARLRREQGTQTRRGGLGELGHDEPVALTGVCRENAGPPPLVKMATRRPRNCRCELNMVARSSISSMDSARMTPAWRSRASTATSPAESAAVCDTAARRPASVRPAFTATMGTRLRDATVRFGRTTAGPGSTQGRAGSDRFGVMAPSTGEGRCSATSALLPTETNPPIPSPRTSRRLQYGEPDRARLAEQGRPPWWGDGPTEGGVEPHRRCAAEYPRAIRADEPHSRAAASRMRFRPEGPSPSAPVSANPAEMTQTALTPRSPASATRRRDRAGRHADDDEIRDDGARGQIRIGGNALHRPDVSCSLAARSRQNGWSSRLRRAGPRSCPGRSWPRQRRLSVGA